MSEIVYYHDDMDGFTAAWMHYRARQGTTVVTTYTPCAYKPEPPLWPGDVGAERVYLYDITFPEPAMLKLLDVGRVSVVDHHLDRISEELRKHPNLYVFGEDHDRSAAYLAYLFHRDMVGAQFPFCPLLVQYVDDRDRWQFKMPHSRAVSYWMRSYPKDFGQWDLLVDEVGLETIHFFREAKAIQRYVDKCVAEKVRRAVWVYIGVPNSDVHWTNIPLVHATEWMSEIGEALYTEHPFAPFVVVYYLDAQTGEHRYSLRSTGYDVAQVARRFGGGGHQRAAGFRSEKPVHVVLHSGQKSQ